MSGTLNHGGFPPMCEAVYIASERLLQGARGSSFWKSLLSVSDSEEKQKARKPQKPQRGFGGEP